MLLFPGMESNHHLLTSNLATRTGFEPVASCVTGMRSNQTELTSHKLLQIPHLINITMKYYQHFDLPHWKETVSKILDYYYSHREEYFSKQIDPAFKFANLDDILEKIPEINEMLKTVNATAKSVCFFELGMFLPEDKIMHSDGAFYESRFLIPLLNCEGTETRFYTTDQPMVPLAKIYNKEQSNPMVPVPGSCTHVDTLYVGKGPALIRVNEIHSVVLPENFTFPRITMLLDINEDLTHLLN